MTAQNPVWYGKDLGHADCDVCGERFFKNRNPRQLRCSEECSAMARRKRQLTYYYENQDANKLAVRLRKYGLPSASYMEMYEEQGGECAMCGESFPDAHSNLVKVDHCHRTGEVRGLLCNRCNSGLHYMEDESFAAMAARYLGGK